MSTAKGDAPQWEPTWKDYAVSALGGICFVGQVVLCFTSYNRLNSSRVLYLGWTVLAVALLMGMSARRALEEQVSTSKKKRKRDANVVVASGAYGVVRHPTYLSFTLVILSLILISQHWLSAILGLPWMIYLYLSMLSEEHVNIEQFGDVYHQYMHQVPRVNLITGAMRYWRRRRERMEKNSA